MGHFHLKGFKLSKPINRTYSFFQDAHMMIIGGIGYLIAFLKRYQWSAFSFNFVLAAFTYQWSLLVQGRNPRTRAV